MSGGKRIIADMYVEEDMLNRLSVPKSLNFVMILLSFVLIFETYGITIWFGCGFLFA